MKAIYPIEVITNKYIIKNYYRYHTFYRYVTLWNIPQMYCFSFSSNKDKNNKYLICG